MVSPVDPIYVGPLSFGLHNILDSSIAAMVPIPVLSPVWHDHQGSLLQHVGIVLHLL